MVRRAEQRAQVLYSRDADDRACGLALMGIGAALLSASSR
jgi:hypothetical protein